MPLFKRPDGDLVTDESPVRRMIPYLMLGRNESAVYHDQIMDLGRTKAWLKNYNRHHQQPATLFHLLIYAIARGFHERPGLNRFVSGQRIYQRKGVQISFAAKKRLLDSAPLSTIKQEIPKEQTFTECVEATVDAIQNARGDGISMVDKELKLALALPGVMLGWVMTFLRFLDRINLLPGAMIKTDPMYASAFIANLGSIGLDRTYHHLYEYGTISLFAALGTPKKIFVPGPGDKPIVKEVIEVRWAFDERINDGFYCATAMRVAQRITEDPERYLGDPTAGANRTATEEPSAPPAAAE